MKDKKFPGMFISILFITSLFFGSNCTEKENFEKKENNNITKTGKTIIQDNNQRFSQSDSIQESTLVFIGTYSSNFFIYKIDTAGSMEKVCISPSTSNPSYLAIHPNKKWLYAVNENNSGTVSSFSFDTTKSDLTFMNSKSTEGSSPCYVSIDNTGKFVMAANYNTGNIIVFPINEDGSLAASSSFDQHSGSGPVTSRQSGPHAHMIIQTANNFVYSTDLGADKIYTYSLNENGIISSAGNDFSTLAGAGPRHLDFHRNGKWAYAVCEIRGTVESYTVDNSTGALIRFQSISTIEQNATNPSSADIHISPDGKYLYASNRGSNNNIAIFSIDQDSGELTSLGFQSAGGNGPRSFVIDPDGKFLLVANQNSNNIVVFKIDPSSGLLTNTGKQITISTPVCLKLLKAHIQRQQTTTGINTINY